MSPRDCWISAITMNRFTVSQRRILRLWREQGGKCGICGDRMPHPIRNVMELDRKNMPTIDHIVPRAHGGKNGMYNLRAAHSACNVRRGVGTLEDIGRGLLAKERMAR